MKPDRWLVAVALVAVAARLAAQLAVGFYEHPETWEQGVVARNIAQGLGYQLEYGGTTYHALVAPAYPFLLALLYFVFGVSPFPVGVLQLVIGAAMAVTISAVALRSSLPRTTAILAGTLVALHPGLVIYAAKIHPLAFDALLAALVGLALVAIRDDLRPRSFVVLGALGGIVALERVTFLPAVAITLAVLALGSPQRRAAMMGTTIAAVVAVAIVAPWLVRNELTIGTPTIVTAGGLALWLGNNPVGSGGATLAGGVPVIEAIPAVRDVVWGRPEIEQEATLRSLALQYIAADPMRALRDAAGRLLTFWWAGPQTGVLYPAAWTMAYLIYYVGIAGLALLGVGTLVRRHRWLLLVIGALSLSVATAHAVTYVEGRHRWAIEPELLLLAATGMSFGSSWLLARVRTERRR